MRALATLAVGFLLAACDPGREDEPRSAVVQGEIRGGEVSAGDAAVFYLRVQRARGVSSCSAVLVGKRTLATAAHCLYEDNPADPKPTVFVTNRPDVGQATASDFVQAVELYPHPGYPDSQRHDIGLLLLPQAPPVSPRPFSYFDVSTFAGKPLRAVGYGATQMLGSELGVRRSVSLAFNSLTLATIRLGDSLAGKGICPGDSGGPSFHVFPDGVERVVGLHINTWNGSCTDGEDLRVDAYASFIEDFLTSREGGLQCAADARCNPGCAQDPDCLPFGASCTDAAQCSAHRCVADPQHTGSYCSRACSRNADCPLDMECSPTAFSCWWKQTPTASLGQACAPGVTQCLGLTVCAGPAAGPHLCRKPCSAGCSASEACITDESAPAFCAPALRIEAAGEEEGPLQPQGCATSAGLFPLLAAASLLAARRRLR